MFLCPETPVASGEVCGFLPTAVQKVINAESKVCGGFPGGTRGKETACNAGDIRDAGSFPGSGRPPGGGHGDPLQSACLENPHGQKNLVGYSLQGCKDTPKTTDQECTSCVELQRKPVILKYGNQNGKIPPYLCHSNIASLLTRFSGGSDNCM